MFFIYLFYILAPVSPIPSPPSLTPHPPLFPTPTYSSSFSVYGMAGLP